MKETLLQLLTALCVNTSVDSSEMIKTFNKVASVEIHKLKRSAYIEPVYEPKAHDLVFLNKTAGILIDENVVFFRGENGELDFDIVENLDVKMFGRVRSTQNSSNIVAYHLESFKRYKAVEHIIAEVAIEQGLPARVLKSMLYTESKFDPNARSHTGVRGIAMITRATAEEFGINTSSTKGQIAGMAKILNDIMYKLDAESYTLEERYQLASFCYNRGMKHYYLARKELANIGVKITYRNTMQRLKRWRFCEEGIRYVKKIDRHTTMFA